MNTKNFMLIVTSLFVLHTIEEALFRFWQSDTISMFVAQMFHTSPLAVYVIGQILLYLFLLALVLYPNFLRNIGIVALSVLLISEAEHDVVAILTSSYAPGMITGSALFVLGILYVGLSMKTGFLGLTTS